MPLRAILMAATSCLPISSPQAHLKSGLKPKRMKIRKLGSKGRIESLNNSEGGCFVVVNGEVNGLPLNGSASVHEGFDS